VTDLLGGQISIFFGDVSTALPPTDHRQAECGVPRSPEGQGRIGKTAGGWDRTRSEFA
jgi:hypothetical protein